MVWGIALGAGLHGQVHPNSSTRVDRDQELVVSRSHGREVLALRAKESGTEREVVPGGSLAVRR